MEKKPRRVYLLAGKKQVSIKELVRKIKLGIYFKSGRDWINIQTGRVAKKR